MDLMNGPTPQELRKIASGEADVGVNIPCPFCGTKKLNTRIGDHIFEEHRESLFKAVALYKE